MNDTTPTQQPTVSTQPIQGNSLLNSLLAPLIQPGLQLQQTQAEIPNIQQQTQESAAQTALAQGEMAPVAQKANVVQFQQNAKQILDAVKDKNGYVDPKLFETLQSQGQGLGLNADQFFQNFGAYSDPTQQINYNTPEGRELADAKSQIVRQVEAQVNQYNKIPDAQKGIVSSGYLADLGPVGQLLAPDAYAYQLAKGGFAGQFKNLTQVNRVTQAELNNWANLLPDATDSPETVNKKIQELDTNIQATFNSSYGLDPSFMKQYGGNNTPVSPTIPAGNASATIPMQSPSGNKYHVPQSQLFRSMQNGYSPFTQTQ